MKTKKLIVSLIPYKNTPLLYEKTERLIRYYGNDKEHQGFLTPKGVLIELIKENRVLKIYLNGKQMTLDYSIGIDYPFEKVFLFENYRIDTTGKYIYLTPLGKHQEAAYELTSLEIELLSDMKGADATMAGGNIKE